MCVVVASVVYLAADDFVKCIAIGPTVPLVHPGELVSEVVGQSRRAGSHTPSVSKSCRE